MEIQLVNLKRTVKVDDADFFDLNSFEWRGTKDRRGNLYATTRIGKGKASKRITMHRFLMNFPDLRVDHIDSDGLNNQRKNLRQATASQNTANAKKHHDGTLKYKGIHFDEQGRTQNKYRAAICVDGKRIRLGRFPTAIAAARAYDAAAIFHFGEFAKPNFPQK